MITKKEKNQVSAIFQWKYAPRKGSSNLNTLVQTN